MTEDKIEKIKEKKEIDVFSIFKKEKVIRFETDDNFIEILMVKLNQGQRKEIFDIYYDKLEEKKIEYRNKENTNKSLKESIKKVNKIDIIKGIIEFEKSDRERVVDLLPKLKELSEEEKKEAIKKELEDWENKQIELLKNKDDKDLQDIFIESIIESKAILDTNVYFNNLCLSKMCLNTKTKEFIFKSADDVLNIKDKSIMDWLLQELSEFRTLEDKDKRKISTSGHFLDYGQSQNV